MTRRQRGGALLLAMLLGAIVGMTLLLGQVDQRASPYERDRATASALAQAKDALIGHAVGEPVSIAGTLVNAARPGDLPCPDLDDDGIGEPYGCGNGSGSTGQNLRLGRLPWKELGLPDLRDAGGERLWYAVSSNFKKRYRYNAPLNSDTPGTITIRDATGRVIFDGSPAAGTGVVAVIIAPGEPLSRASSLANSTPYQQNRTGSGTGQAINYLDLGAGEDNAGFADGSGTDGFIAGPVADSTGRLQVNDRLIWITAEELAPHLEKRAIGEVAQCLKIYASVNGGRYPWPAAATLGTGNAINYYDTPGRRLGRIPDTPFANTQASAPDMDTDWTGACHINSLSGWWLNWKEVVFYAVAEHHKPAAGLPAGGCGISGLTGTSCLSLDGSADRQFLVLAAGRRLAAANQMRTTSSQKNSLANYLEGANLSDDDSFASVKYNAGSNDRLKGAP